MTIIAVAIAITLTFSCASFGKTSSTSFAERLANDEIFALECLAYMAGENEQGKNSMLCQNAIDSAVENRKLEKTKWILDGCKSYSQYEFKSINECIAVYKSR